MQRLIDADALLEKYHNTRVWDSWVEISNAPTIDPVHAAGGCYCRECEYRTKDTQWTRAGFCGRRDAGPMMIARPDDFCSRGKRREEDDSK
ncbi:MAG TPA: hypothetical protein DD414_08805 [Lachnospiraceae bacterium]|nr:hypothetical protein [Lachnospiraceae bacterium]